MPYNDSDWNILLDYFKATNGYIFNIDGYIFNIVGTVVS